MSLTDTPNASRLHIALFGRRNSGKSSLINALTGQDTALVSDTPGTTTDLVSKAMEMQGIGPCLFIDTPGFDDEGELGELRISRTLKAIEKTDIALLLCGDTTFFHEKEMLALLKEKNIPVIPVLNKIDIRENNDSLATYQVPLTLFLLLARLLSMCFVHLIYRFLRYIATSFHL